MKNLKKLLGLMAVSTIALVGMANVHATTGTYPHASSDANCGSSCAASIDGTHKYSDLATALTDAQSGDTIKLLASITSSGNLGTVATVAGIGTLLEDKSITINLNGFGLEIGSNAFKVGEGATLTIVGNGKANETLNSTNATAMFVVQDGGTLITKGGMTLGDTGNKALVSVDNGTVKIGTGATLDVQSSAKGIIIGDNGATVSLNAKYGSKTQAGDGDLFDTSAVKDTTKISFEGGEYYTKSTSALVTVGEYMTVAVNDGTFKATAADLFVVNDGTLMVEKGTLSATGGVIIRINGGATRVSGGTLTADANAVIKTETRATEGTLTINGGTLKAKGVFSPLYFDGGEIVYNINGNVVVEGPKNTPAIYINDNLLTGLEEDGDDDNFDAIVTGGKFLYSIVGGTADGKHTSADVTKYILGSKLTAKTEGNYQVVGNGSSSTPSEDPGTQAGPGDDEPSKSPATFDAIGSLVTMAISSLGVVGTATKKLFR